jgi:hypothetical protein
MKLVREYINEKFEEYSDSIHDLSIGGIIFDKEFEKRRIKIEKDIEKFREKADEDWKLYLRKLLIDKTITAKMEKLATFDRITKQKKTSHENRIFTIKVADIVVSDISKAYNNYLIIADYDHKVYRFYMKEKIYIR